MATNYSNISIVLREMGNYPQALEYHEKALEIDKDLNDRVGMAMDYWGISVAFKGLNKHAKAMDSVEKGLNILLELE